MSFQIPDDYQMGGGGGQNISLGTSGGSSSTAGGSGTMGGSSSFDFTANTPSVTTRMPFGAGASLFQSSIGQGGGFGSAGPGHGRYDDLKLMLESNKDGLKLEAMRRIVAMMAKGRSGDGPRELFAHVVKSVVTQNVELKKLVYLYLTRYAEQEQDLALLSVSSFQRSLKDPNPLIRASALRVLSSIRVSMIAPIMLVAIRESANDMSPYVRKTAAHAIPKLYTLEPDMREEIIQIIERLLQDRTSLVLASAVYAFEQVCPDRIDLLHQNYRKFCALMADFDEWGQVILMNLLLRYARTQFTDPNIRDEEEEHSKEKGEDDPTGTSSPTGPIIDTDLRLLLRSVRPLLSSRNSCVALSVIQIYFHLAPRSDMGPALVKPLIRLLHSHREIQLVILANIVSMTSNYSGGEPLVTNKAKQDTVKPVNETNGHDSQADVKGGIKNGTEGEKPESKEKDNENEDDEFYSTPQHDPSLTPEERDGSLLRSLFEPHLKSFFIKSRDSTQVKIFKLQVLTNLANSSNIPLILREFQAYIQNFHDSDVDFVAAVIHAIGACAARIKEVSHICLNGLIGLLSNRNPAIVAHSIVVIRSQIVNHETTVGLIIKQITKLFDTISTPQARATIIWILAEFCDKNNRAFNQAPDVLRKVAKVFHKESDLVKLQALNLAAKLYVTAEVKYGISSSTAPPSVANEVQLSSGDEQVPTGTENGENGLNTEQNAADLTAPNQETKVVTNHRKIVINEEKLKALVNYIFNLAKYDLNYDVRDRGRFLRALISRQQVAEKILLTKEAKKARMSEQLKSGTNNSGKNETSILGLRANSPTGGSNNLQQPIPDGTYRMGSLSHFLGRHLLGYEPLPAFPVEAPDRTVRDKPEPIAPSPSSNASSTALKKSTAAATKRQNASFYSDESEEDSSDGSDEETTSEEESSEENSDNEQSEEQESEKANEESGSEEESSSGSDSDDSGEETEDEAPTKNKS